MSELINITTTTSYDLSGKGVSLTIGEGGKMNVVDKNGNPLSLQDLVKLGDQKTTEDPEMASMEKLRNIANNAGYLNPMQQRDAILFPNTHNAMKERDSILFPNTNIH